MFSVFIETNRAAISSFQHKEMVFSMKVLKRSEELTLSIILILIIIELKE